jgi:hypothetical protein
VKKQNPDPEEADYWQYNAKTKTVTVFDKQHTVLWTPKIRMAFLTHLIIRVCLEILFLTIAYRLQVLQTNKSYPNLIETWMVPEKYTCYHSNTGKNSPCWQDPEVVCWVARPYEKTILVRYILFIQLLSIFLTLVEMLYFACKWSFKFHLPEDKRPEIAGKLQQYSKVFQSSSVRHRKSNLTQKTPAENPHWKVIKSKNGEDLLLSGPNSEINTSDFVVPIKDF